MKPSTTKPEPSPYHVNIHGMIVDEEGYPARIPLPEKPGLSKGLLRTMKIIFVTMLVVGLAVYVLSEI